MALNFWCQLLNGLIHIKVSSREETEKFSPDITWSQRIISVKNINIVYREMKIHSRIENQEIVLDIYMCIAWDYIFPL